MRRSKLWRMVAVGFCSAMLVSSLNVFADSGSGGGSEIVNEGGRDTWRC